MSPCPEVIFGALSRMTKRIRLGFGVVILPYHHPVRVAERVAMVDHMSGGRVEFGTGRSAAYEQMGMRVTQLIGTLLDGDARHTPEGVAFSRRAQQSVGAAVAERDAPFGDYGQRPR